MNKIYSTPKEAEDAFYDAIERADMDALDAVWANSEGVVCVHPGAIRVEGRQAVLDSFAQLFADAPSLSFSIVDTLSSGNESLVVHQVREEVAIDGQLVSIMVATNIFQIEDGGWRLLLHHASPEPELLMHDDFDDLEVDLDDDPDDWQEPPRPPVLH